MEWLERNLEAYRLVAEVLAELRTVIRRDLERIHGEDWYRVGLPDGLLERLIESKEREKAIDWYESEYQQVIDYAVFPDLLEVLEINAEHFPHLTRLAPSLALLHARFLELEVIRSKLGRSRPVSDGELAFLGTFYRRFVAALEGAGGAAPPAATTAVGRAPGNDVPPAGPTTAKAPTDEPTEPAPVAVEEQDDGTLDPELTEDPPSEPAKLEGPPNRAATRPPQRSATGASEPAAAADTTEPDGADEETPAAGRPTLLQAIENGDTRNVLRELYREVTGIADGIWTSGVAPSTPVWDAVSTSTWYEENFSKIGLRPLSDFYEVVSQVSAKIEDDVPRPELQKFLKNINFAQVLLALRDMFQKAGI